MLAQDHEGIVKRLYRQLKACRMDGSEHLGCARRRDDSRIGAFPTSRRLGLSPRSDPLRIDNVRKRRSGAKAQAAALFPFWRVATVEIAGPLMSIAMLVRRDQVCPPLLDCCSNRNRGAFSFRRTGAVCVEKLSQRAARPPSHAALGDGRVRLLVLTGAPVRTMLFCELALIVLGLVLVGRAMQKETRFAAWAAMACGMGVGFLLYLAIGPHVLLRPVRQSAINPDYTHNGRF
jgi:hypothetical protein